MTTKKPPARPQSKPTGLLGDIRVLIETARQRAVSAVNSELPMLYWRIGQRIHTQVLSGQRAGYGEEVLPTLAEQLGRDYGNSFMERICGAWCSLPSFSRTNQLS